MYANWNTFSRRLALAAAMGGIAASLLARSAIDTGLVATTP